MNSQLHARATELFLVAIGLPTSERSGFVDQSCGSDGQLRAAVLELLSNDEAGDDFLSGSVHDTSGVNEALSKAINSAAEREAAEAGERSANDPAPAGRPIDALLQGALGADAAPPPPVEPSEFVDRNVQPSIEPLPPFEPGADRDPLPDVVYDGGPPPEAPDETSPLSRLLPKESKDDLASLGGYSVERRIGEGGMGLVYQARRPGSAQPVAIKVLRPELATTSFVQRLEAEAWALSQLEHPGIAKLLDSGTWPTADGLRPYLVMELVRGRPLTAWAREGDADMRTRLEVLARLCDAVHHAHLRGVIHRDLKPANVLVTEDGRPKVLDFGIARLADRPVGLHTVATDLGRFVGTLAYMSPEQVREGPHDADMRADVYALGVMAYELLGGRLPVDVTKLSVAQAVHAITHATPVPLGRVDRSLRGDVEMIVGKAMHLDRSRRYGTAAALGEDIRRHLAGQPVEARPPTFRELITRAIKEHPWSVAACAVVLVALMTGLVLQSASNRQLAADKSYMTDLLGSVMGFLTAPVPSQDPEAPTLEELLLHGDTYLATDLAHRPDLEGAVRVILGRTLANRFEGLQDDVARAHFERGIELLEESFGKHDARTLEARIQLASLVIGRPDSTPAEVHERLEDLRKNVGEAGTPDVRVRVAQLEAEAADALGQHAACLAGLQTVLVQARQAPGVEHDATQRLMASLVRRLPSEQAIVLAEELVDVRERVLGHDHSQTIWARGLLGRSHRRRAQSVQPTQPELAELHYDQAETILRDFLESYRFTLGDRHLAVWNAQIVLAWLLNSRGKHDEALGLFEYVAEEFDLAFGRESRRALSVQTSLGEVARRAGDLDRAKRVFQHVLEALPGSDFDNPRDWGIQRIALGQVLLDQKRYAEAEVPLLRAARDWDGLVTEADALLKLHGVLYRLYDEWGRPEDAERHAQIAAQERDRLVH